MNINEVKELVLFLKENKISECKITSNDIIIELKFGNSGISIPISQLEPTVAQTALEIDNSTEKAINDLLWSA